MKLYQSYKKAKELFIKPVLRVYFGLWKKDPNLPVYRKGPTIWFCRRKYRSWSTTDTNAKCYPVNDRVLVKCGNKNGIPVYNLFYHKLPNKLENYDFVWSSRIRRKLRKYHLGWLPCCITLPSFFRFKIYNFDVMWKYKFDDIRFEFPPQFTIVAFGLSLTFWLQAPKVDKYCIPDHYWEPLLSYVYEKKHNMIDLIKVGGIWNNSTDHYFALRKKYIKKEYWKEYTEAAKEVRKEHPNIIIY